MTEDLLEEILNELVCSSCKRKGVMALSSNVLFCEICREIQDWMMEESK
tara:strand:- start:2060 stop:2206 length:147 start_codon:yes stop_codon:yes gene_type:complete